jgi:hypothetical protein
VKRSILLFTAMAACGGKPITTQLTEPVRVSGAQFWEGELPGQPALTGDDILAGVQPEPPYISSFDFVGSRLSPGEQDRAVTGRASVGSLSVGLRLQDVGSGFWLIPVGAADVINNNEPTWSMNVSFNPDVPPGKHRLIAAAFDASGWAGTQGSVDLCIPRIVPDNRNACDPTTAPPAFVASLEWDTEVDLDLKVITPSGKVVDPRHPSTAPANEDGDVDAEVPGTGIIDIDSNRDCVPDGKRRENLVFQDRPPPGTYVVYANLFDPCGEASVRFEVSLHQATAGGEEGTFTVAETFRQAGEIIAVQANAGRALGTFVTEFTVQ